MKTFKEIVNEKIDLWEKETTYSSAPFEVNHDSIKYFMSFKRNSYKKRIIISTIFERIKKKRSWIILLLANKDFINKNKQPHIGLIDMGHLKKISKICIEWGEDNNYI